MIEYLEELLKRLKNFFGNCVEKLNRAWKNFLLSMEKFFGKKFGGFNGNFNHAGF